MEIVQKIIELIIFADVLWSLFSFIGAIPLGKPWVSPRFPILITIIIMLVQIGQRKRTFYCEKCQKNLIHKEMIGRCSYCDRDTKIKFMDISGRIYYKCSNINCKHTNVISLGGNARTRFYVLNPYGSGKRSLICQNCRCTLSGETVINLSLYSGTEKLAKDYREDFFYHSFGPAKSAEKISVVPVNASMLKDIDKHYEKGISKLSRVDVPTDSIALHFKTESKAVNQTLFQFRIAVKENLKLQPSEGIILLLDGTASGIERQSVVDHFLVDLQHLNTQSAVWTKPILVGVCANGVQQLETAIDSDISSAEEVEQCCKQFLLDQNNGDVINRLYTSIENIHFFLYRTGSAADGTESKIYNVVQPGQALLYEVQREMRRIWTQERNGYCPMTHGKS